MRGKRAVPSNMYTYVYPKISIKKSKKKCNQQGWWLVASVPLPYTTIRNEFRVLTCLSVSVALKQGFQVQSGLVVPRCTPGLTIRRRTSCLGREPNACLGPVDTPPRSGFFFSFLTRSVSVRCYGTTKSFVLKTYGSHDKITILLN